MSPLGSQATSYMQSALVYLTGPETTGRLSGTEGARRAASYLAAELQAAGYQPAGRKGYFDPVEVAATRLIDSAHLMIGGRELRYRVDYGEKTALSIGGTFTGTLMIVQYGDRLTPSELAGQIVLVPERPSGFDLAGTAEAAAELGVLALLVEFGEPRWFYKTVYTSRELIPLLQIRKTIARELSNQTGVHAKVELPLVKGVMSCQNVLGWLPGNNPDQTVLLAAHYDHVGDDPGGNRFPGALDNASGVVAILAIARELASHFPSLPFNILVAFLTGEESGLWGAKQLAKHPPVRLSAAINLDGIGTEPKLAAIRMGRTQPEDWLSTLTAKVFTERGVSIQWVAGRDDSSAFLAAGIPTVGLGQQPTSQDRISIHTPDDSLASIYLETLSEGAEAILEILAHLTENQ